MSERREREQRQLSMIEHVVCAWPFVLVAVGGALGGACGGLAWAINTRIMASTLSAPMRYGLVFLSGLGAAALYFVGVMLLVMFFPNMFGAR